MSIFSYKVNPNQIAADRNAWNTMLNDAQLEARTRNLKEMGRIGVPQNLPGMGTGQTPDVVQVPAPQPQVQPQLGAVAVPKKPPVPTEPRASTLGQPKPAILPYFYVQARMRIFAQSYQKPEISKCYD